MKNDFNLFYYIEMYKKWRKPIIKLVVTTMLFTLLFSYFSPSKYVSTVTIISTDSRSSSAPSYLGRFLGLSEFSLGTSTDIVMAILNSKRMSKDISSFLKSNKQHKFNYSLGVTPVKFGLIVSVAGNNPEYTKKVANFVIENLDKINSELNITPAKPIVKVLDPASYGTKESRHIIRKIFVVGLLTFLLMSVYIFLFDYLKKPKK